MCATILWGETLPMREDVGSSGRYNYNYCNRRL